MEIISQIGTNYSPKTYKNKRIYFSFTIKLCKIELNGSVLIANPVPAEYEISTAEMELHIQQSLNQLLKIILPEKMKHLFYYNT